LPAIELTEEEIQWLHAHLQDQQELLEEPNPDDDDEQAILYRLIDGIISALEPGGA